MTCPRLLYYPGDQVKCCMGRQVAHVGERNGAYRVLEVTSKGKRLLEIPRR
jgi:hypothetical protein